MESFKFKIKSLLSRVDGSISGPMSPMLFAVEMMQASGFKFNRLARVSFEEEAIHQKREDGGLTGYDTLVIGAVYDNDIWLSLWIDKGTGGIPVAMAYQSEKVLDITPVYRGASFSRKLSPSQISEVFGSIFSDINLLEIKEEAPKSNIQSIEQGESLSTKLTCSSCNH